MAQAINPKKFQIGLIPKSFKKFQIVSKTFKKIKKKNSKIYFKAQVCNDKSNNAVSITDLDASACC